MSAWGTLGLKSTTKTQHLDPTGQIVYFCHSLCHPQLQIRVRVFILSLQFDFIVAYYIVWSNYVVIFAHLT